MEKVIIPLVMRAAAQAMESICAPVLPEGYRYVSYQPGDEIHWADIISSLNMLDSKDLALEFFRNTFMGQPQELLRRCWFIVDPSSRYVATSTAWFTGEGEGRMGVLHWVAARAECQGKGLGKAVVQKVLSLFPALEPGRTVMLDTQSFRTKAVGLYLAMGFRLVRDTRSAKALNELRGTLDDRLYALIAEQPWPDAPAPGTPVHERFLRYVNIETPSDENCPDCPSSRCQLALANLLADELRSLGADDARVDAHGYVYASLPANVENAPSIGLIAHMDTVDCVPVGPMRARIIAHYPGGDIALSEGEVLREEEGLALFTGDDLIVTDGKTLLGADDKAGVAEIMAVVERLRLDPSIPHGRIAIGFTPDEEIGRGADRFDVQGFGADFAYTVDGGLPPEIEYENFNAASMNVVVSGVSIHPGSAKNRMMNALMVAMEFSGLFPPAETPAHTEGREGFYHLNDMNGGVERAVLHYIIRDHDREKFEARKAFARRAADYLNARYGAGTVAVEIKDSYYNMREVLKERPDAVERAMKAIRRSGMAPVARPIRGGTDGARLSFMGLPCPNLPTGGLNAHGRHECASIQQMDRCVAILLNIVRADSL